MKPTFYEFFAGDGMARAGLEPEWRCLFANDIDPKSSVQEPGEPIVNDDEDIDDGDGRQ